VYITSVNELRQVLRERRRKHAEIRSAWNRFIERRYGIQDVAGVIENYFSISCDSDPIALLARQIASICVEDIAFNLLACALQLEPLTAPFIRDAFTADNHDKVHRIKIPWISWPQRCRAMVLQYEQLTPYAGDRLEGVPLDRIDLPNGGTLVEFHAGLREKIIPRAATRDVSQLHTHLLWLARNRPPYVFREINGRERKTDLTGGHHEHPCFSPELVVHPHAGPDSVVYPRDRPPASWYYPLYFSWFLDGSMVLFETYDNPIGNVSHAKALFEETMGEVWRETGYLPLVVKIPPLSKEMLYCNRHLLEQGGCFEDLGKKMPMCLDHTVLLAETIAHKVINFR
jgi:hypothetical protein